MTLAATISPRSAYAAKLRGFPDLIFAEQAAFAHRGQWAEWFGKRIGTSFDGRIIFEIGCFDAEYLSRIAAKHPTTAFVGLDWKCKPLVDGAMRIVERGIRNIALLRGRGQDIAKIFAEGELDEIWVFHPDPCDRPAELPNRLISAPFLGDVHRVLRDRTSLLCLKTDHIGYYQSVKALFEAASPSGEMLRRRFEITANSANFWQDPAAQAGTASRGFAGEATLFEHRFTKKKKPIYYFEMRKRHEAPDGHPGLRGY